MTDKKIPDSTPKESQNQNKPESGKEEKLNTDAENTAGKPDAQKSSGDNGQNTADESDAAKKSSGFNAQKFSQDFLKKIHHKSGGENSDESDSKKEDEENEDNSYDLNDDPYFLQIKLERSENEYTQKTNEYNNLTKKIEGCVKRLATVIDFEEKDNIKERKDELERTRGFLKEELKKLEKEIPDLKQRLKKAEFRNSKRPKDNSENTNFTKETENISIESLFEETNSIKGIVLYVATFFPNLSPPDFEQVVSFLLAEQTTNVTVKSQITTEQGEVRLIEKSENKPLAEIWKESQHDILFQSCLLRSVEREDSSQIIDFNAPDLREKLKKFLKEERTVYLSQKFKQARLLIFEPSVKLIAINAMYLSVDMAISSPSTYGEDWLFEIIVRFTERTNKNIDIESESGQQLNRLLSEIAPEKRRNVVFARISSLIEEMLAYSQLKPVVKQFLENLMLVKRYDAVLEIVKHLHSVVEFDELYWVKQLLDRGDEEARSDAYRFLCRHLEQNNSRIYELLETIKTWLPKSDCPPRKYSQSNKYALQLIFEYCIETMSEMDLKHYGCCPSKYPLFVPLNTASIETNTKTLIGWIFHPDDEGELAIKHLDEDIDNTEITEMIGFLIVGWFMILWGLEKKEPEPEVSQIADGLIRQIILHTNRSQQKELIEFWRRFIDYLLEESESDTANEDNKLRKQALRQRHVVKQLKKQFTAARKTITAK